MTSSVFCFGRFRLDHSAHELRRDGVLVDLPVSAFDCLLYLIQHRDRPVGRDELILAVWSRPNVSETLLGQTIVRLRRELGDSGSDQHSIRTIARKGYRWVAPTVVSAATLAESGPPVPVAVPPATAPSPVMAEVVATDAPLQKEPAPRWSWGKRAGIALAMTTATALIAIAVVQWPRRAVDAPVTATATTAATGAGPALVLPTLVSAPADWDWLRLGLMDLIANRLRRGTVNTVTSESVVGLVKGLGQSGEPASSLLADARLDATSRLRIQPTAALVAGEWRVRLDVVDQGRSLRVDAQAEDVLLAGRRAADLLLLKLGKQAPPASTDETPVSVADVMQRAKAAALAGQLEVARSVIAQAPADIRSAPEVVWSSALIEATAGHYERARELLQAELPRLPAERDPVLRARMLTLLAAMYMRRTEVGAARAAYDEAIALTEGRDDGVLSHAYAGRGVVEATLRQYEAALADLGRARVLSESAGNVLGTAQIDMNLGSLMHIRGQPAAALSVLQDAAERLKALSSQEEWAVALQAAAAAQLSLLDAAGALKTTASFSPPQASVVNERLRWSLALTHTRALADNGRTTQAQAVAEAVRDAAAAPADALFRAGAAATLAYLAQRRGDPAETARLAGTALSEDMERADVLAYVQIWQLRLYGLQRAGQVGQARGETAAFLAWLASFPVERSTLLADFATAEQAAAEGHGDEALPLYAKAFAKAEQSGVPDDMVMIGTRYVGLLIERRRLEEAATLAGRLAPWSDRDRRAAAMQTQLYRALAKPERAREWEAVERRMAGDGPAPK